MLLFIYYSITLDNIDISTLNKDKAPASTNNVEIYNKETLSNKIRKLTVTNTQLMIDKIKIEKVKINLEADKVQLFGEKNSLIVKRKEFRTEIVALYVAGFSNVLIYRHQDPLLRPI